jgi:AraC-like DNA-binding protein
VSIILPHQEFGSDQGYLDLGIISWLALKPANFESQNDLQLGAWSGIPEAEARSMGKLLCMNDVSTMPQLPVAGQLLHTMQTELSRQEIGYTARVNQLIDELLITLVRHLSRQSKLQRDFPKSFMKLEQSLRSNLSHQWLVEEMAVMVGLGTTAFTEKVKSYTGFSPLHYLINIRIAEAIRLLKNTDLPVTDIALDTGFYSSQHFATTFKKLTGYTPRHFRQNNKKNS